MILLLAGTGDARVLAARLKEEGYPLLATVVTENAASNLRGDGHEVIVRRLTSADIADLLNQQNFDVVVDATHPFAELASRNALEGAKIAGVPYIRFEREEAAYLDDPNLIFAVDYVQAAEIAAGFGGVIMLTTGSKTLEIFAQRLRGLENTTLIARMLPREDNMQKCAALGIPQKNIVAMQGPFSKELNHALYDHYQVDVMITKESGKQGSVDEKVQAALERGIKTIIITRPKVGYGIQFSTVDGILEELKKASSKHFRVARPPLEEAFYADRKV